MKKVVLFLVTGCILFSGISYAQVTASGNIHSNGSKARKVYDAPNAGAAVLYTLSAHETFYVDEAQGNWYAITVYGGSYYGKLTGWISAEGVIPGKPPFTNQTAASSTGNRQTGLARVAGDDVNFREAPVDGRIITSLKKGTAVFVFGQLECEDGFTWYHVNAMHLHLSRKGWIRGDLLELPDSLFCDLVDVAIGESHVIALKSDGTVIAGGTGHCDCTNVEGLYNAVNVSAGFYTSFVFFEDGSYWGNGLGFAPYLDEGFYGMVDATTLGNSFVGIHRNGTFLCNSFLLEGCGETYDATDLTNIIEIATGFNVIACLTADGRVHMYSYTPERYVGVAAWEGIEKISAYEHVVGLRTDGTVVAVGENLYGECDVQDWTDIVDIAASENYTLGLRADGTVVATGNNAFGACDVEGFSGVVQIEADRFFSVGRTAQGTLCYAGDFRFLDKTDAQGYLYMSSGE